MSNKELVIEAVRELPEDVTLEAILEHLAILAAICQGQADAKAGRVISHEEMKRRVASWIFEIVWTDRASADLQKVFAYISEQDPTAAGELVQAIMDRVELLKAVPRMGKYYTTRNDQEIRQIVSGKYRIFYTVVPDQDRVEILAVWHGARQEPDRFD